MKIDFSKVTPGTTIKVPIEDIRTLVGPDATTAWEATPTEVDVGITEVDLTVQKVVAQFTWSKEKRVRIVLNA